MKYKPTIGLEIHAELKTNSKMFCSCKNNPDERRPNVNICPVCAAHPGTLPVANEVAVEMVQKAGLALNCKIAGHSKFDRKSYFYPDLPKGYQISQYDQPLCENGFLEIGGKRIRIRRIHLEEDTGRLLHPDGADYSLVDLNRAGIPLMELVTEPDITSGKEAREFAQELQLIFRYLGISDADMEKGLMRVEVNISVSKDEQLGTKVEIKNLNSFRVVERSIDFEIARQTELLESGGAVVQETRGWNDAKEVTVSQREKEEAHDYRYFPEPDLPPMHFDAGYVDSLRREVPELPQQRRERFAGQYDLDEKSVEILVSDRELGSYYEKAATEKTAKLAANYLISDVRGLLQGAPFIEDDFKVAPDQFADLMDMIVAGAISTPTAKIVLANMVATGGNPEDIVRENNWQQVSDTSELEAVIKRAIGQNPKAVADYKNGNANVIQFLAGQVMKETRGTANPQKVRDILTRLL